MVAWTIDALEPIFTHVGFSIVRQEYFTESGDFVAAPGAYDQDDALGIVRRSFRNDSRNAPDYKGVIAPLDTADLRPGEPVYTSLWIDAVKPPDCQETLVQ